MVSVNLPDVEAELLTREACARGMTLADYIVSLAHRSVTNGNGVPLTDAQVEERIKRMREWFDSVPARPKLADDSRDSIY